MTETPEQLLQRIRLGEDSRLELRTIVFAGRRVRGPSRDVIADELAAFANSSGGAIVFGVDDKSRQVVGIPGDLLDVVQDLVLETCKDSIRPSLTVTTRKHLLPANDGSSRPVLCVEVGRSVFVHESPGGYLHRVGSSKRRMEPDHLARLFQQRAESRVLRFDEQVVAKAEIGDLDAALVDRFQPPRTKDAREVLLRKLAMAAEDEGKLRPTVAGVLLGSKTPEKWLPNAFIQAVAYRGDDILGVAEGEAAGRGYQLDARDIVGPLDEQVVEACRFVHRNMRVEANKQMGRQDVPQYDMEAVFEAVVNAAAHRDYSMLGSKIRLRMFANRMEIYSPGGLTNSMTLDALPLRVAARNQTVCSLLARCAVPKGQPHVETPRATFMDRRGEGIAIIAARTASLAKRPPTFQLADGTELILTIPAARAADHWNAG
jgi:predicted HTH transcriptional regulator